MTSATLSRRSLFGLAPLRAEDTEPAVDLGGRLAPVAEAMVELADVREGQTVLAVAAGNRALAKAAAGRRASVATAEGVWFTWPDSAFDAVLAFFSVTSHRDPRAVAGELKRVARPRAPIVLVSWSGQAWARYETAYRHFFGFPELDVTDHELEESGMGYSLVFARKPGAS